MATETSNEPIPAPEPQSRRIVGTIEHILHTTFPDLYDNPAAASARRRRVSTSNKQSTCPRDDDHSQLNEAASAEQAQESEDQAVVEEADAALEGMRQSTDMLFCLHHYFRGLAQRGTGAQWRGRLTSARSGACQGKAAYVGCNCA